MIFILLLALIFAPNAWGAISHVQTTKTTWTNTTGATSASMSTTAGSLIVLTAFSWTTAGPTSGAFSDSLAQTFTENPSSPKNAGANGRVQQVYKCNNTGSGTHTFTFTPSGGASNWGVLLVSEYTGIEASSCIDKNNGAVGTSAAPRSGESGTRSQNDELLVVSVSTQSASNQTISAISGWTIPTNGKHESTSQAVGATSFLVVSAPSSLNAGVDLSASDSWGAILGTFKASAAATTIKHRVSHQ